MKPKPGPQHPTIPPNGSPRKYCVGVIGGGFVGHACRSLECPMIDILVFDANPQRRYSSDPTGLPVPDTVEAFVAQCDLDLVFVCVPTPMRQTDGSVHTNIVEAVVRDLQNAGMDTKRIIVRSTVPPGTCDALDVCFMPEFLTEHSAIQDFIDTPLWIIGLSADAQDSQQVHQVSRDIAGIFQTAAYYGRIKSDQVLFTSATAAELSKYMRHNFLATKISFCNEFATLANKIGVEYDTLRHLFCMDARIGLSHTEVPGPDGDFGFEGSCFLKDMNGIASVFHRENVRCPIIDAVLHRNDRIDRLKQNSDIQA